MSSNFNGSLVRKIPRIQLNTNTYKHNGEKSFAMRVHVEATPTFVLCGTTDLWKLNKMLGTSQG